MPSEEGGKIPKASRLTGPTSVEENMVK